MSLSKYLSIEKLSAVVVNRLASFRVTFNRAVKRVVFLPTVFISVTDRCNSRCASCGIWKAPGSELSPETIEKTVVALRPLGLRNVIVTGGEPLVRSDLAGILDRLLAYKVSLVLCTNGILLKRRQEEVLKYFDSIVVSLDSHERVAYEAIRGVDAFDDVVAGITAMTAAGMRVTIAHTLQKGNIQYLTDFINFTKSLGVDSVSIRPVDAYSLGFGSEHGQLPVRNTLLPLEDDLAGYATQVERIAKDFSEELDSGFIAPSIFGLRKMREYFLAKTGESFPETHCDAPFNSCAIEANGDIKHCFFVEPFANINRLSAVEIRRSVNTAEARKARNELTGQCEICRRCAFAYMWL